jgi:nitroreductase
LLFFFAICSLYCFETNIKLEINSYKFVDIFRPANSIIMEALEAIFTRRSIRRYSDRPIDKEIVDKIIYAGMYAPSAVNKQPWHFIVFNDPFTRKAIMEAHQSATMLRETAACILVCYDERLQHDEGYGPVDCSAATQNMLLAAHALGIGACWVGIYPRQSRMTALKKIFGLPDKIIPFAIVAMGYPAEVKSTPDRIRRDRIHIEKWQV